ncbi:MAG: protein kinase [Deltaproteobacteria bacterium]|nr:protein kinase [Deltaproteobacteria bacterium]
MLSCGKCKAPCLDSHRFCPACGSDLEESGTRSDREPLLGTTIAQKFILREVIGSGGMGKVFSAEQKGVGRTVAVKIMHRHLLGDETAAARFTNEARASSSLNHPNSIAVLDFGQTEVGMLYIVMEHLRGRSLDVVVRDEFPLSLSRVADILCQALQAVEAAHQQKIIHRDLKPENIFLLGHSPEKDFVKVLDFGIAKMLDHQDRSVTTPGLVPGTPEYMSPEQARGEALDARSDVYSMGVILYELLTSSVPFRGSSAVATMMSHVQDPVPSLKGRRPDLEIPTSLESIAMWALAKEPDDRISSAAQFYDVLTAWARVAGAWPEHDPRLSSPDVLVDLLGEQGLGELANQLEKSQTPTPTPNQQLAIQLRPPKELVGRNRELLVLRRFLEQDRGGALRIEGEVGTGLSRIVDELVTMGRDRGYDVFRAIPGAGWAPELLHTAQQVALHCLGVRSEDYDSATLLQAARSLGLVAEDIPGLQQLFGLPNHLDEMPADVRRQERAASFRTLIRRATEGTKLLLIFDQYERCDTLSRDLCRTLTSLGESNLALVVAHRPDADTDWPAEFQSLRIRPLPVDQALQIAEQMLGDAADIEVVERISRLKSGHPLFIEQWVYGMVHEGLTEPPQNLADLVATRAQHMGQSHRSVLQWMAVYNDDVSADTISKLRGETLQPAQLETLTERGMLVRARGAHSRNQAHQRFMFSHRLVGMVVYSSIPAEVRREMHQKVAAFLRKTDAPVMTIAYHAFQADDGPDAVEELQSAGEWAMRCLDTSAAIHHYMQALALVRREWGRGRVSAFELDDMAVSLALKLADVLRQMGDSLTAEGVLAEVLSVSAGADIDRARLRLELGRLDLERGNLQRAGRHLLLARSDAERTGEPTLQGEVTRELARAQGLMGERERAGGLLFEAMSLAKQAKKMGWYALVDAANTAMQIGYPERARGYLLDALTHADRMHSIAGKLQVVTKLVGLHNANNEHSEAEMRIMQGIDLSRQVGDRTSLAELMLALARLRRVRGDAEGARTNIDEALRISDTIAWDEGRVRALQEMELLRFAMPQKL